MTARSGKDDGEGALAGLPTNATLIAWLVFLGFGSAFLAFYYSQIHYFPELKWEESFAYLAAISVLGGGVVAVYGLLLFVPGWIWSEFVIFDAELVQKQALCYKVERKPTLEPCFWRISLHLVVPFATVMLALHLALATGDNLVWVVTAVLGVLSVATHSLLRFSKELGSARPAATTTSVSFLWKYVAATSIAALSGMASLFILNYLLDPERQTPTLLTVCTLSVVVTNLLVAVQFRHRPAWALVTSMVAAITVMILGELFAAPGQSQSERMMANFGIGESSHVSLDLIPEGKTLPGGVQANDVVLLSRLGEEYLVAGFDGAGTLRRVALKKKEVKSWATLGELAQPISTLPAGEPGASLAARASQAAASAPAGEPLRGWVPVLGLALIASAILYRRVRETSRQWATLRRIFRESTTEHAPEAAGSSPGAGAGEASSRAGATIEARSELAT